MALFDNFHSLCQPVDVVFDNIIPNKNRNVKGCYEIIGKVCRFAVMIMEMGSFPDSLAGWLRRGAEPPFSRSEPALQQHCAVAGKTGRYVGGPAAAGFPGKARRGATVSAGFRRPLPE